MQPYQIFLITIYFILILLASYYFQKNKIKSAIILVSFATFFMLIFFIFSLPFVNEWDERFHAVVAKNIAKHFPIPTLYEPPYLSNVDYLSYWTTKKVWLHKQPIFLWQMALFIKLLGKSVYTLRIPDAILGTLLVYSIYRIGKLTFSEQAGFLSAVLFSSTIFLYELANGRRVTDHNDLVFISYVTFSIQALLEYYFSKKTKWLILIGLFSGIAILNKWLIGLLPYAGWGLLKLYKKQFHPKHYKDLLQALLITIIVFVPLQIYSYLNFPDEFLIEQQYNALHITKAVEGQSGDWTYHFLQFPYIYGTFSWIFIFPALFYFIKMVKKEVVVMLLGMVIVVYIFFSVVATKMPAFTGVVYGIILVIFGGFWDFIMSNIKKIPVVKKYFAYLFTIAVLVVVFIKIEVSYLSKKYGEVENSRDLVIRKNYKYYRWIESLDLPSNSIAFGKLPSKLHINIMFYKDINVYGFIPDYRDCLELATFGKKVIILACPDVYIPEYITYFDFIEVREVPMYYNYGLDD